MALLDQYASGICIVLGLLGVCTGRGFGGYKIVAMTLFWEVVRSVSLLHLLYVLFVYVVSCFQVLWFRHHLRFAGHQSAARITLVFMRFLG